MARHSFLAQARHWHGGYYVAAADAGDDEDADRSVKPATHAPETGISNLHVCQSI